jgi:molybdenum cofactor cytidylyltransferase
MGEPKQLLRWGDRTVLATTVHNLVAAGASPVLCVVGHRAEEMIAALGDEPATLLRNENYLAGEMLSSYQTGVQHLLATGSTCLGALLALGDQPHVPVEIVRQVIEAATATPDQIVIPSYQMRRGHPFYLPARLWPDLVALALDETLRTLLQKNQQHITYVNVENDSILRDIDTPDDYRALAANNAQP